MLFFKKPAFFQFLLLLIFLTVSSVQCKKESNNPEFPDILMEGQSGSPANCDTIYTGDFLEFKATFSDEKNALSAYAVEIHNSFDNHIHQSTDLNCPSSAKKDVINPFYYIRLFELPEGSQNFEATLLINIPESIDTGDYHVFVRLANVKGYQSTNNETIKILHKN
jgi:hypothetical protein